MNFFAKAKIGMAVFKPGKVVLNPAAWKGKQVNVNQVISFVSALVLAYQGMTGHDVAAFILDPANQTAAGTLLYSVFNWLFTVATTDKIGLSGKPAVAEQPGNAPTSDGAAASNPNIDEETRLRAVRSVSDATAQNDMRGG